MRGLNIALRSLHLVGMAGMAAHYFFLTAAGPLIDFWGLTLLSGLGLVALYTWNDGRWLLELRGGAIIVKLLLLWSLPWLGRLLPDGEAWGFALLIILSSLIAHAPGRVRHHALFPYRP